MRNRPQIILIGLRASGKSTVGRLLSTRLRLPYLDLDDSTASLLHAPNAAQAIAEKGIRAFRHAEATALEFALKKRGQIIALGGGTPTAPSAADQLRRANATIIYLHAEPEVLRERLRGTDLAERPALMGDDPLAEVDSVYLERDPLFRELSQAIIEVGGHQPHEIADAIDAMVTPAASDDEG